jgi:hypothetical protein
MEQNVAKTADPTASPTAVARELLARTSELPRTKRELLAVLSEYRTALVAFAMNAGTDQGRSQN